MTPEQRSRCMAAIKGKNTKPEILVRKFLFAKGLRFRINTKLPGKPDIVLPKYKTVIFIDGCFWHGHEGCKYFRLPSTNVDFWRNKIETNVSRDKKVTATLEGEGWRVIRIWECQLKTKAIQSESLASLYHQIIGEYSETACSIAAEPVAEYGKKNKKQ